MIKLKKHGVTMNIESLQEASRLVSLGWEYVDGPPEEKEPVEKEPVEKEAEEGPVEEDPKVHKAVDKVVGKMGLEEPEVLRQIPDEEILGLDDVGQVTLERVRVLYPKEGE